MKKKGYGKQRWSLQSTSQVRVEFGNEGIDDKRMRIGLTGRR